MSSNELALFRSDVAALHPPAPTCQEPAENLSTDGYLAAKIQVQVETIFQPRELDLNGPDFALEDDTTLKLGLLGIASAL